jgi:AraC-like DNA-binding protein
MIAESEQNNADQSADPLRLEIAAIIARFSESSSTHRTPVPRLHVARVSEPIPPTSYITEASVSLCILGPREIEIGGVTTIQNECDYLLSAVGLPTVTAFPNATSANMHFLLRIDLDLELAREVMTNVEVQDGNVAAIDSFLTLAPVAPVLLDAVARLVRLIEVPGDIGFMSDLVHREILYRLLSGPAGHTLRQIVRLDSQRHRVAEAVGWLRAHFREPVTVRRLAAIAGMGESTLHRHFRQVTGMSPVQYQKQLRLHEARRAMLDESMDVGMAALSVGYESSTQFIREYRRLFGQPPLRDAKLLRARGNFQKII